jgi:hypothetical protein
MRPFATIARRANDGNAVPVLNVGNWRPRHSYPKKLTSGMTGVKAIADVARRRNRSEEIYKAGAQRLVTAAT